MSTALAKGLVNAGLAAPENMIASDPIAAGRDAFGQALVCETSDSNAEVLAKAKVIFLAFKPYQLDEATEPVREQFTEDHLVISNLAGVRLAKQLPIFQVGRCLELRVRDDLWRLGQGDG